MKKIFFPLLILCITHLSKAQKVAGFTISEIGWTFSPPINFILIDSASKDIKMSDNLSIWRKDLIFKHNENLKTTVACSIMSDIKSEEEWSQMRPTEIEQSYLSLTRRKPNLVFDSTISIIKIGGIDCQKFLMSGKENGQLKYFHIQISKFYKGYRFTVVYMSEDSSMQEQIEKQLINSKFD